MGPGYLRDCVSQCSLLCTQYLPWAERIPTTDWAFHVKHRVTSIALAGVMEQAASLMEVVAVGTRRQGLSGLVMMRWRKARSLILSLN